MSLCAADPPLTNKIFEVFHCRQIGPGESLLVVDHTVMCKQGGSMTTEYLYLFSFADLLVCAWPLGVPGLLFLFMWRVRAKIYAGDEDTLKLYDFVIGGYTDKFWYWELVELARKLILSGLIGLLGRGTVGQTVAATFISFFFFAVFCRAWPFKEQMLNRVKVFSEFVVFGVLVASTVAKVAERPELSEEYISLRSYETAQAILCAAFVPVTAFYVVVHI
eukprot:SAG22_NODE_2114_length_2991_cov_1.459889_1_plen_219_part_10